MIDNKRKLRALLQKVHSATPSEDRGGPIALTNFMGTECKTVGEVAAMNQVSDLAAAYGIVGSQDAGDELRIEATKMLHAYRGEHSGSIMISFALERAFRDQIAWPEGDDPGELHVTLGYFGDISNTTTEESFRALCTKLAATLEPMMFKVGGVARFSSEEGDDAFVALVDHPKLPEIYMTMWHLANVLQVNYTPNHGYTPHITLGWLDREDSMPLHRWSEMKAYIGAIELHYGTQIITYPLGWVEEQTKDVFSGPGGVPKRRKKLKAVRRANMIAERC